MRYKLILAYDGIHYAGWQQQKDLPSIEQELKESFVKVFGRDLKCIAASRTDAGVHALGQVLLCTFELALLPERIKKIWNDTLPSSITIRSLEYADEDFHPWYNVARKEYHYYIASQKPLPFIAPYVWYYKAPLDYKRLSTALQLFKGTYNFSAFASADDERTNVTRTIDLISIDYIKRYNVWQIRVVGKKFLRHMIRRMVGAAVYVAVDKNRKHTIISDALTLVQRKYELPTAPAHGLVLRAIVYH